MFKKPLKASSKNQLSGKDKKDLKTNLLKNFHAPSVQHFFSANSKLIAQKITDLKISILVNQEEDPLFICFPKQDIYIPTVYLIAQYPHLVPSIQLKEGVEQFVLKGANVMCPGVQVFPETEKGTVIAVNTSKGIVIATGYMGDKANEGIACTIIHHYGDKLWEYGSKILSPVKYQQQKLSTKEKQSEKRQGNNVVDTTEGKKQQQTQEQQPTEQQESQDDQQQDKQSKDRLLQEALYNVIKLFKFTKEQYPIPITTFYSKYVKVASPVPLDVSHSSYKKVSTFFQKMAQKGLIGLGKWKQKVGNTTAIINVDKTHPLLKQYKPTIAQLPNTQKQQIKLQKFKIVCDQKLQTFYQLTPKIQFLRQFTKDPEDKLKVFEERELQYLITRYLGQNKMKKYHKLIEIKQKNKPVKIKKEFIDIQYLKHEQLAPIIQGQIDYHLNNFKLEQQLSQTIEQPILKQVVSVQFDVLKRNIFKLAIEQSQLVDEKTNQVIQLTKKKQFNKIKVQAFKSHNKNVTTINYLESFLTTDQDQYQQLQQLSHYLQLKYACGSVVRESTDGGKYEVYLQGNVYDEVIDFLVQEQGVDPSLITGMNKLPKKKKK